MARLLFPLVFVGVAFVAGCSAESGVMDTSEVAATSTTSTATSAASVTTSVASTTATEATASTTSLSTMPPTTLVAVASIEGGLFCRDLSALGYGYADVVAYWELEGSPDRMDADHNGVPCQTVYDHVVVIDYWGGPLPTSDFEEFAYLVSVDPGPPALIVTDYASWFTGEEAQRACEEDGLDGCDDFYTRLYYIRNVNPRLRTLHLDQDVGIAIPREFVGYDLYTACEVATLEDLRNSGYDSSRFTDFGGCILTVGDLASLQDLYGPNMNLMVWLRVEDGNVLTIQGQYVP